MQAGRTWSVPCLPAVALAKAGRPFSVAEVRADAAVPGFSLPGTVWSHLEL